MKKISPFKVLKRNWPILAIITAVGAFGFISLGNLVASPKAINRLEIFLGTDKLTISKLEDKINENKTNEIYKVNITAYNEGTSLFNSYFNSAATGTDIIIVSSDIAKEENMESLSNYVSSIDTTYLEETLGKSFYYLGTKEKMYAFQVYNKDTKTGLFKDIIDYSNKDQYLMFGKSSIHIGKNNTTSTTTEALKLLRNLFNGK